MFAVPYFGVHIDTVLLVLTTAVSLEAIYLAIFIQMSVNENTESLEEVEEDIDEIQHDVDEIQHDVDEIQHDVDEIQEDVDEIQGDVERTSEPDLDSIRKMLAQLI
jgi:peptidoglycan hydrolase CwlO-like protein